MRKVAIGHPLVGNFYVSSNIKTSFSFNLVLYVSSEQLRARTKTGRHQGIHLDSALWKGATLTINLQISFKLNLTLLYVDCFKFMFN